jgi:CheY-like chemotaxis protein
MKKKILLVEDDTISAFITTKLLPDYEFDIAYNSTQALEKAQSFEYELILMDINLIRSQLDGLETMLEIRKIPCYQQKPIFALTAYVPLGRKNEFIEAGFTEYIVKPIVSSQLKGLIEKYLSK